MPSVGFWSVTVSSVSVAVAGALVPLRLLSRLILGFGWFFGWGSVLAGISDLVFGWPNAARTIIRNNFDLAS